MKEIYKKSNLEKIVSESKTLSECLDKLGLRKAGGNYNHIKKYIKIYDLSTLHFEKNYNRICEYSKNRKIPLDRILVENSTYSRCDLKKRLYQEEILLPICSLCGQDENWKGVKISLIIDHINGVFNDNRIENLRIVCPNCNAGLDTFCGRSNIEERKNKICNCGNKKHRTAKRCQKCYLATTRSD